MTSLRDVAEAAGVSIATVSHVINGTRFVSPELTERVQAALRALDYQPNLVARSLRTQRSQIVGLITSDITNPFYPGVAQGASNFLEPHGYSLIVCDSGEDSSRENKAIFWLKQRHVDGLLFTSVHMDSPAIKSLHAEKYPFVLINRKLNALDTNYVGIDNRGGMALVVRHLAELGHRTIGFISGVSVSTAARERLSGFLEAAQQHGMETGPDLISHGDYRLEDGHEAVHHFLKSRRDITAVVAANDLMAFGAWQGLHQLGIRVPEDISIVGFDDIPPASMGPTGLTTVRSSKHSMGSHAARILLDTINANGRTEPQQIVLDARLMVRNTTAKRREHDYPGNISEALSRLVNHPRHDYSHTNPVQGGL